jgi:hypothetical protein
MMAHWIPFALPPGVTRDPYLDWAEHTNWRGIRRLMGQLGHGGELIDRVRILVQLPGEWNNAQRLALITNDALWSVAPIYAESIPGNGQVAHHFTAELTRSQLGALPIALQSIPGHVGIRWELALPFRDAETAARAASPGLFGQKRASDSFRPEKGGPAAESVKTIAPLGDTTKRLDRALAIIDFGCPFLNDAFAGSDGQRIAALWDQGSHWLEELKPWFDATGKMGYGRILWKHAIDALVQTARMEGVGSGRRLDEGEIYRQIDYLIDYDDPRRRIWAATHGSHVTSIAAGTIDPLVSRSDSPIPDAAGQAPIVFVQLPSLTGADCAGGSLGAQVLDALRFVLEVCEPRAPIVVNLSYGSFAGPHDGTSLIEQAMDELIKACDGRLIVVLGAGNSREAHCHVRRTVRTNQSALLRIDVDPGDFTDTFVEAWFDATSPDQLPWANLLLRARTSDGDWSPTVKPGQAFTLVDPVTQRSIALLRLDAKVPNGSRPLGLLCIAPTARPADDDGPLAPAGCWEVEVFLDPDQQPATKLALGFDAWVERDDPGWLGHGVQPRFAEQLVGDDIGTLSSLATGRYTIVVGGFRESDWTPTAYSSIGYRPEGPPMVYAVCEHSADLPAILAAAVRSADSLRMNGTSVAGPVFARRAFNWLLANWGPVGRGQHTLQAWLEKLIDDVIDAEPEERRLVLQGP